MWTQAELQPAPSVQLQRRFSVPHGCKRELSGAKRPCTRSWRLCRAVLVHEAVSPPVFARQGGTQDMHRAPRERLAAQTPLQPGCSDPTIIKESLDAHRDVRLNITASEALL